MLDLGLPSDGGMCDLVVTHRVFRQLAEQAEGLTADAAQIIRAKDGDSRAICAVLVGRSSVDRPGGILHSAKQFPVVRREETGNNYVDVQVPCGAVVLDVHAACCAVGMRVGLLHLRAATASQLDLVRQPVAAAIVADPKKVADLANGLVDTILVELGGAGLAVAGAGVPADGCSCGDGQRTWDAWGRHQGALAKHGGPCLIGRGHTLREHIGHPYAGSAMGLACQSEDLTRTQGGLDLLACLLVQGGGEMARLLGVTDLSPCAWSRDGVTRGSSSQSRGFGVVEFGAEVTSLLEIFFDRSNAQEGGD